MKDYRKKSNRLAELAYTIKKADTVFNFQEIDGIDGVLDDYRKISQELIIELEIEALVQKQKIQKLDQIKKIRSIRFQIEKMKNQIGRMISLKNCGI